VTYETTPMREALEKPSIEIGGVVYTGRLLSWPQSMRWLPKPREWVLPETEDATIEKEVVELLTLLDFKDPEGRSLKIEDFLALERTVVGGALAYFFRLLRQSHEQDDGGEQPKEQTSLS
jgi:hypothetical protein